MLWSTVEAFTKTFACGSIEIMAGLGRRTHYRKHLTDKVLNDFPVPGEKERIAKICGARGTNQFDIWLAEHSDSVHTDPRPVQLAILPTKFRKLIWLKRNDCVIVETGDDGGSKELGDKNPSDNKGTGIRYMITHILYKEQQKYLKEQGLWPSNDPLFQCATDTPVEEASAANESAEGATESTDLQQGPDGIVYEVGYGISNNAEDGEQNDDDYDETESDLFINTNRMAKLNVQDSSDSDEER